ncbi:MAG TPA: class I SAM-dependent methyltransferase [Gemmatimonadaceae bacterium]|nr:class I SAM-dependent methyltransferase [Gemmatimonadaceae bacterium]
MSQSTLDTTIASQHASELRTGERFSFGENWRDFLRTIDDQRIAVATASLKSMLGVESLAGRRFVDIGSGSGLFSLAAHRLGADVTSFDYDPSSVGCTLEMRSRYAPDSDRWRILHGSALDADFVHSLGTYDVVYSWGVLHHTGQMWNAINNVIPMVADGGLLFIAIYNDQGVWSKRWTKIKQVYCSGALGKLAVSSVFIPYWAFRNATSDLIRGRAPWHTMATYKVNRGMSVWHDWHDWLGGYPFEAAKPEGIIFPIQREGFTLVNLNTQYGSVGCVEYVFRRD